MNIRKIKTRKTTNEYDRQNIIYLDYNDVQTHFIVSAFDLYSQLDLFSLLQNISYL